ncbi:uncharacterized protein LOC114521492 [Dendronephthya gigantea]|uniref:uncharacterized protein LOC114521492 n=1 Tax=Dendronephthya gigantea TaxID=151771 RepID=UPI00106C55A9|nr:uncharacterized protein LOC114521492 [Dendronephthya gigantea]
MIKTYIIFSLFFGLAIEAALAFPTGRNSDLEHKIAKRNFVPNRFDIVDNEIKHAIQKEVQNALRKNFVPNNPLLEANKWGRSSSARYPVNQPTMVYGMEYDQINPSRSDPGYLVLDLKKLAQGRLKFHEQQLGSQRWKSKPKAVPKPKQKYANPNNPYQQQYYNNYGAYQPNNQYGYQPNNQYGYQPNYQNNYQQPTNPGMQAASSVPQYGMQG